MPASSIDTFFACSLMVILIVSAMAGTTKVVQPYLDDLAHTNGIERYKGIAEYLLGSTGTPANWGTKNIVPSAFDLNQTQSLAERILNDRILAELDIAPLDSAQYPGYVDEAVSLASIASDGLWLNNGTADGLVLHYNINGYPLPVLKNDGDPFEVKFADLPAILDGFKTSRRKGRK